MTLLDALRLSLVDSDTAVAKALRHAFGDWPEVSVIHGDILRVAVDAVVSPANGYGYMDGGLDRRLVEAFGDQVQRRVLSAIDGEGGGVLEVGRAVIVTTGHPRMPWLIVAPTMPAPDGATPASVFFAMSAVLRAAARHREIAHVFCPGLGTGVGQLDPEEASAEMAAAYARWRGGGRRPEPPNWEPL